MELFWGKLARSLSSPAIHPLEDHCLDVAVVFRALCQHTAMGSRLWSQLQVDSANDWLIWLDRFAVLAHLHDLGKCNWGFQAKRFECARETTGHSIEGAAFLINEDVRAHWPSAWWDFMRESATWFEKLDCLKSLLFASISHHGKPISEHDCNSVLNSKRWWRLARLPDGSAIDPMVGIVQLLEAGRREFPQAFRDLSLALAVPPAAQHRFAGILMLADWIASDTHYFPFREALDENRRLVAEAAASRALSAIGLIPRRLISLPTFDASFGFPPSALQAAMDILPIDDTSRILLIESETGSGKTEAALRWFWRLYHARRVEGLYFALPTRVAAREMYGRILKSVEKVFPDADQRPSPVLLAIPGYAKADGASVLPSPQQAQWDDQSDKFSTVWAAERPKRFLAAPIAVGTLDQAMLSVMRVKHALMRSVCLDRHLLVIDEVHASNTYMREILATLTAQHIARGGWVLLLSATLGESARVRFMSEEGTEPQVFDRAVQRPYPAITTRKDEIPIPSAQKRKTIALECIHDANERAFLGAIMDALHTSARVLVICNTVDRAIHLQRAFEQMGVPREWLFTCNGVPCPHHGRYARRDREQLDGEVTRRFGKNAPSGSALLVGTQTLEQSLDIDADLLVTDLAPMDVLLQRIGRLHRHERERPSEYRKPRAMIRIPARPLAEFLRGSGEMRGPDGLGTVYEDGLILQATLNMLLSRSTITIPAESRELIERTTHPEALAELPNIWQTHRNWILGQFLQDWRMAGTSLLEDKSFGDLHYDNDGRAVLTRLGIGSVCIRLKSAMSGPFGIKIDEILVPARWLPNDGDFSQAVEAVVLAEQPGFRFNLAERRFNYSRFGLERVEA